MRSFAALASALVALALLAAPARAGHELPFYPGYYPQEIRLETLTPAAAVPLLRAARSTPTWEADPFAGGRLPANVSAVESLAGYVVATPAAATPGADGSAGRCAGALAAARAVGAARGARLRGAPVPGHPVPRRLPRALRPGRGRTPRGGGRGRGRVRRVSRPRRPRGAPPARREGRAGRRGRRGRRGDRPPGPARPVHGRPRAAPSARPGSRRDGSTPTCSRPPR